VTTRIQQDVGERIPDLARCSQNVYMAAISEHVTGAVKHPIHAARKARGDRLEPTRQISHTRRLDNHVNVVALDRVVHEPEPPALARLPPALLQLGDELRRAERGNVFLDL
jgi:hypothetical protein